MFLPIKADFHLPRFPLLTVLVCLVCVGVFVKQQSDWQDFGVALGRYCNASRSHIDEIIFERINEGLGSKGCANIMYTIANDPDRSEAEVIADMTAKMRPTGWL